VISFAAFGAAHGVSQAAVSKAARRGRLAKSVARDARGRWHIVNVDLADREWRDNVTKASNNGGVAEFDTDPERLVFDLLEFVLTVAARECVVKWKHGRPTHFNPNALQRWLNAKRSA
jgi:hypothetical protein